MNLFNLIYSFSQASLTAGSQAADLDTLVCLFFSVSLSDGCFHLDADRLICQSSPQIVTEGNKGGSYRSWEMCHPVR